MLSSEYFVDWIKHAFITKFNNIPVEVCFIYRRFILIAPCFCLDASCQRAFCIGPAIWSFLLKFKTWSQLLCCVAARHIPLPQCFSPPGRAYRYSQIFRATSQTTGGWGLRWTSIPPKGSNKSFSHCSLQKQRFKRQ